MIMGCWRFSGDNNTHMSYKRIYKGPALTELEAGNSHICGLTKATMQLRCWQWPGFHPTTDQHFISNAVGEDFLCGLSKTGAIRCMGRSNTSASNVVGHEPRDGHFSSIAAGFQHACAVSSWGELVCWGDAGQLPKPHSGFAAVALGENCSCARRLNGTVVCWGENNFKLPESLRNECFTTIVAKRSVFCGVLSSNFSLICWGRSQGFETMIVYYDVLPGPSRNERPCSRPRVTHHDSPSEPPSQPPNPNDTPNSSHNNIKSVSLIAVGSVGSFSLIMTICFWLYEYCRGRICRVYDSSRLDEIGTSTSRSSSIDHQGQQAPSPGLERRLSHLVSLGNACTLKEFPLQVLLRATDNFSQDHKIGSGSFGSVYHAVLEDGCEVAIKRAETSSSSSSFGHVYPRRTKCREDKDLAFLNELELLSRLKHKNLVHLLGFCEDCNELILVYEYMHNGTLHDHIHRIQSSALRSWTSRLNVALDAARGIEYLHVSADPPIIHRDIKSSNILLDANWTAKVSDFGLSLMGPGLDDDMSHLSVQAAGTVGYLDPEYYRLQKLTMKTDVYSFGVVLLELLSGYKAIHKNTNDVPRNVVDFVAPYIVRDEIHRVLDPNVPPPTPFEIEAVAYVGYLAVDCVMLEGRYRPSMTQIVNGLERALAACLPTPLLPTSPSYASSPSNS